MRVQNPGVVPVTGAARRQNEVERNACEKGSRPVRQGQEAVPGAGDDGNSKEKSARIANAAAASFRKKVPKKGGRSAPHDNLSKAELRAKAKQAAIKSRSGTSKSELSKALRNH
jgi:hypothetical protein